MLEKSSGPRLHNGVSGTRSMLQERQHRGALIQVQPHIAFRLRRVEAPAECGERLRKITAGMLGQGLQHPNLQYAAVPPSLHSRGMQPVEKVKNLSGRRRLRRR